MRRKRAPEREITPDARYNKVIVSRFIGDLMWDGKRSLANRIFYGAMDLIEEKTGEHGYDLFVKALENVRPKVEVRPRRVGGQNYQVPVEVRPKRQQSLCIKWLIQAARKRPERTMIERLANELVEASQGTGNAMKVKENAHRQAEANRVFAHFRW